MNFDRMRALLLDQATRGESLLSVVAANRNLIGGMPFEIPESVEVGSFFFNCNAVEWPSLQKNRTLRRTYK